MEFERVVQTRRSVRSYDTGRGVDDATLRRLFDLVALAPSGLNMQPWRFVVVRDPAAKRRLRACANDQAHVEEAAATVICLGTLEPARDYDLVVAEGVRRGLVTPERAATLKRRLEALGADPARAALWTMRSGALACMTLMLAARDMGLATCPMEGFDPAAVRREFGVPDHLAVVMLVALGYEKSLPPARGYRKPFEVSVAFDRYDPRIG